MADIISLDGRFQLARDKKAELTIKRKRLAVKKVFQCTHCTFKCEKCGTQVSLAHRDEERIDHNLRIPYRFCESCSEEYIDYIERLKGEGDPNCYWHNPAWAATWKAWIDYQGAVDHYIKTKEFLQLIKELKQTRSED